MAIEKLKHEAVRTLEEYEAFIALPENADRRFEFIDGKVVEKMPTQLHGWIVAILIQALMNYLDQHPSGWVFSEARHGIPHDDENDRVPDLSFVREELGPIIEKGAAPYMPDLAVEVQSPDDSPKEMRDKAQYYLANGSRMVWLIFTDKRNRRVEVFVLGQPTQTVGFDEILDGGDVLPEFTLAVKALFVRAPGGKE